MRLTGGYFLRLPTLTTKVIVVVAASVLLLLVMVGPLPTARADTTFTVKSSADTDGTTCGALDCTLRQAINAANAASGNDTIVFDVGQTETITLGSQLPTLTDASGLTIDGGGSASITVSGNEQVRVFQVATGAKLTLKNLTVADGLRLDADSAGGGVWNDGTLEVTDSTFSGNRARYGGGILNTPSGTLTITNSTFSDNIADDNIMFTADFGGGIDNKGGTATITGSTFSGNSASYDAGGIHHYHPMFSGTMTLKTTIVANNSGGNCFGTLTDGGYNLDDGTTCGFSTTNNSQPSTNPLLDTEGLQDNGGSTKTIALQAGSPAIDKGNSFDSITDQRGLQRPKDLAGIQNAPGGDGSDIGAFELENVLPVATKDSYTLEEGNRSLTVAAPGVLANDSDPGDTLTVSPVRGPLVGTLKLREDGSFVYRMPKRTYLRNEFSGVTFIYEVSDGNGGTDRAKVTINKG